MTFTDDPRAYDPEVILADLAGVFSKHDPWTARIAVLKQALAARAEGPVQGETEHLLSTEANADRLKQSIGEFVTPPADEVGRAISSDDIEFLELVLKFWSGQWAGVDEARIDRILEALRSIRSPIRGSDLESASQSASPPLRQTKLAEPVAQTAALAPRATALPMPEYRYQTEDLTGGSAVSSSLSRRTTEGRSGVKDDKPSPTNMDTSGQSGGEG